jgi:hypothetical protein
MGVDGVSDPAGRPSGATHRRGRIGSAKAAVAMAGKSWAGAFMGPLFFLVVEIDAAKTPFGHGSVARA